MEMTLLEQFVSQIETKRQIKIPICFLNNKGATALNEALESAVPHKVSRFYREFHKYYDVTALRYVSQELAKKRKCLPADKRIVQELASVKQRDAGLLFEISGNLYYIGSLLDDFYRHDKRLKKHNLRMRKTIRISIFLWIYLNIVELVNKYLAEFLLDYLKHNGREKEPQFKNFIEKFKKNQHPELGVTINALILAGLLDKKENSIFNNNHFIRNKLSHANMYYDPKQRKIYLTSGDEYPISQFFKDLRGVFSFMGELIYQLNQNNVNLEECIASMLKEISTVFLRIERSGIMKKAYAEVIIRWKKEGVPAAKPAQISA